MMKYLVEALIATALFLLNPDQPVAGQAKKPMTSESGQTCDFSEFKPIRFSSEDPNPKKAVKPEYPEDAKKKRIEGRVVVKVLVDPDGIVKQACAISGNRMLKSAAEKASLDTIYNPVFLNGEKFPRFIERQIVFVFKLADE